LERRLAAILAADVVGFARLMGADEAATLAALKVQRAELIDPKARQYRGRTIKLMGDGTLMEFPSVVDAVAFAVEVQCALRDCNAALPEDRQILYRIGINIGDIIVEGEDIYGDGVNVAARLEGIAEPGDVCVARNVFNQVKDKLDLTFENLGQREVKNIAEPVSVYRIVFDEKTDALKTSVDRSAAGPKRRARALTAAALAAAVLVVAALLLWRPWMSNFEPVDPAVMARPLPAKPSIAVLSFDDLSQGDDRGYMSDAIAEGIITKLSYFSELFVIARNSSFFFKGKAADVREIAIDLGARYILEGSQQKAGERLRVTVQLIDALAGNHIWAETYDRDLVDVFAVQDEIAASVASTIGAKVVVVAGEAAKRGDPARLRAFEHWLTGTHHWYEWTKEGNELAREYYLKAVEADPTLSRGHLGLAWAHINGYRFGWTELDRDEALSQARLRAQKGLDLAPDDYFSHQTMANVHMQAGERARALVEFEKALALNPNAANLMMDCGEALVYADRTREAINQMRNAMRRDPHHADWFYWNLGWAQYFAGDYEDALVTMNRMSKVPGLAHLVLAAAYVRLGRLDEARAAVETLLEFDPEYSVKKMRLNLAGKYQDSAAPERYLEDLRRAGLPEE
jgi:TolB-like protein/class 3 adenylate cyclase/Tfp pilus assembly protein PilF